MKKQFFLLAVVFAFTVFSSVSAKADGLLGGLLGGGSSQPANSQPTCLPIDNGVIFLVAVAIVIGFVAIRKARLGTTPSTKG